MSSAVDEDTARAINSGRETLGAVFSSAQTHLQKVFIVFVIGFMGTFYALRIWVWGFLEATAKAEMAQHTAEATDLITRTPFEVILLQAKIGMVVGVIVAIPALLYYSRDALRRRGVESVVPITKTYLVLFGLTSITLAVLGIVYAYSIFFPYVFDFLASNAVELGVKPSFGITEFTEFIALLTISFGLAAQLPLFMGVLSYTEIVPYETFRDKWRHAIVGVTVFGALFSPPDPFTLIMWAMPMVALYVLSLGLAKVVTNIRRRGAAEAAGGTALIKRRLLQFGGGLAIVFAAAAAFIQLDGFRYLDRTVHSRLAPEIPYYPRGATPYRQAVQDTAAAYGELGPVVIGAYAALAIGGALLLLYTLAVLRGPVYPRESAIRTGDPEEIDLEVLDAEAIEAVPPQVFLAMEEEEALDHARTAMYDDDKEKAQAILDRYDTLQAAQEGDGETSEGGETAGAGASGGSAAAGAEEEEGSFLSSTAAGMLDPFTEEETTEEDVGGYAYDLVFILNSLTSKMFRIVGTFLVVMAATFFWLYQGGVRDVLVTFLDRMPEDVLHEVAIRNDVDPEGMELNELINQMDIVIALHPVEVLIFAVKVSVLAGVVAVLPLILYYGWPAARERGLVRGDERVFLVWGGTLLAGFAVGTYLGFFWVAPAVISYLVADAINAGMTVSFRIKSFFWLVIFTTVGIGFLFNIIVTMALFHVGGIVNYRTMLRGWRPVIVAIFTVAAFVSPRGILTMILMALPVAVTYLLGLAVLYVLTGGGRLFGGGRGGTTADPDPEPGAAAE
ncbi:twin-arginine translocase subunit TatC [Natrononativus amylolyticus]|uniref:twin-arginine translocase subunit TatC n=1 Tax=Natrononativus amylolyticus TaxID=2963434 RepID=UPI0020CF489A|nr:twin-arginine translocase subunit TatC [Natrononativus amylolyticus]